MITLVVGATGLLGTEVCRQLRVDGRTVRALVRRESPKESLLGTLDIEIAYGDLKDRRSLDAACRGAAAVITTATTMTSRRPGDTLKSVDRDGQLALIKAAKAAGVGRFIYLSLSPNAPANNPFVRYKREVEQAVRNSGTIWTILQPAAFMEVHAGTPVGWDFSTGRARFFGSGHTPMSYISVCDVARFAVLALDNPSAANRPLHLVGPEPLTALEAVRIAETVTGRKFKVQRIPAPMLSVLSAVLRPVAPIPASLLALGASERAEVIDMRAVLDDFPVRLTRFEEYVRRAMGPAAL